MCKLNVSYPYLQEAHGALELGLGADVGGNGGPPLAMRLHCLQQQQRLLLTPLLPAAHLLCKTATGFDSMYTSVQLAHDGLVGQQ